MSMSLYVWKSPVLDDTDEATRLIALEDELAEIVVVARGFVLT